MNPLEIEILTNFPTRRDLAARAISNLTGEAGGLIESDELERYLMLIQAQATMTGHIGLEISCVFPSEVPQLEGTLHLEVLYSEDQGQGVRLFVSENIEHLLAEKGFEPGWYHMGTSQSIEVDIKAAQNEASKKGWGRQPVMICFPQGEQLQVYRGQESWPKPDRLVPFVLLDAETRKIGKPVSIVIMIVLGVIAGMFMQRSIAVSLVAVGLGLCFITKSWMLRLSIILLTVTAILILG